MKNNNRFYIVFATFLAISAWSCKKFVEVDSPNTQISRVTVFEDDLTAQAAVSGLYGSMTGQTGQYISKLASLSADEVLIFGEPENEFYQNAILSINSDILSLWQICYQNIYRANSIIEGLEKSQKVGADLKNQLTGEAIFIRAFYHFYLVNLFGNVPYVTGTDYRINRSISRLSVSEIYDKIEDEVLKSKGLLSNNYSNSKGERVKINKWVAGAFLARIYLYTENWSLAEVQADEIIANQSLFKLNSDLSRVFLKNNEEAIWQLIPPSIVTYTYEGAIFLSEGTNSYKLSPALINSFDLMDKRYSSWIKPGVSPPGYFSVRKYRENITNSTGAEYTMVFRLAEQYLIRAEARAMQNKLSGANGATADVNVIRERAGLKETTAASKSELLLEIEMERKLELFTEWGHRWLDLKRTKRVSTVLKPIKANWDDTDMLYPIPNAEIMLNPNLTQNQGY